MEGKLKNKRVLVVGLGMTGVASIKALDKLGAIIYAYDGQSEEKMSEALEQLKGIDVKYYFDSLDFDTDNIDFAIKSPGIKFETPIMKKLLNADVKIIGDLEAGFLITDNKFVAITGTNGKTTTTSLIGAIINTSGRKCKITGNIGSGAFYDSYISEKDETIVVEASSFQLESTYTFKPFVSIITNLSPDHLDWHKTEDNYYRSKFKIAANQDKSDFCILNYEDAMTKNYLSLLNTNILYFSSERILESGIYVENGQIVYNYNNEKSIIMDTDDIFIVGKHNLENVLASCAAAKLLGIDNNTVADAVKNFKGVEHRLEYVNTYSGVKFYNDSKGTNPDASIKAVKGINAPIILIAGGYNKDSEYDEFIKSFNNKVKALILLGETKGKIKECALKYRFENIHIVESMDEAVCLSYKISDNGDTVLLSPACASWDMYPNFEIRGKDFKERVKFYGESSNK